MIISHLAAFFRAEIFVAGIRQFLLLGRLLNEFNEIYNLTMYFVFI